MKEVIQAVNNRIKTPYFGYSILAFIALNWRGVFLLLASKEDVNKRLELFDSVTSFYTLILYPLLIGFLVAITFHWLRYFFALIERKPRELIETLDLQAEHKKTIIQAKLEESRARLFSAKEQELIAQAKRDEEVNEIEDSETKKRLEEQLKNVRRERDKLSRQLDKKSGIPELSVEAKTVLIEASRDEKGIILVREKHTSDRAVIANGKDFGHKSEKDFKIYTAAVIELEQLELVKARPFPNDDVYELTAKGWILTDAL